MEGNHQTQPYDVVSSRGARGKSESSALTVAEQDSLWTPVSPAGGQSAREVLSSGPQVNVHPLERIASGIVGGALLARGLATRSAPQRALAVLGSGLVYRALSGHCHLYQALGLDTAHSSGRLAAFTRRAS